MAARMPYRFRNLFQTDGIPGRSQGRPFCFHEWELRGCGGEKPRSIQSGVRGRGGGENGEPREEEGGA